MKAADLNVEGRIPSVSGKAKGGSEFFYSLVRPKNMGPALFFIFVSLLCGCLAYYMEGPAVLEDLSRSESLFAIGIAALTVFFAYLLPDIQGQHLPRWRVRLFGLPPQIALAAVLYPTAVVSRASLELLTERGLRLLGLSFLVIFLMLSLAL